MSYLVAERQIEWWHSTQSHSGQSVSVCRHRNPQYYWSQDNTSLGCYQTTTHNSRHSCVQHTLERSLDPGLQLQCTDRIFPAWKTNTFDTLLLTYRGISEVVVYDFKKVFVDSLAMKENSASKSWSVNFVWKNWATHARDSVSYKTMLFIEKHLMRRLRITNRPKLISRIWSEYLNLGHRRNYEVKNSYITTKTLIAYFDVSIS